MKQPLPIIDLNEHFYAKGYYERLANYIIEFENSLNEDEEVGAKLTSFGEKYTIHIDNIGYHNPRLICFYGRNENNQEIQLIQDVSQINILLVKVKRKDLQRKRVGFVLKSDLETIN